MKVFLARDLFLGGARYRQRADGTEVPDFITTEDGGKLKVVCPEEGKTFDPATHIVLPKGTEPYVEGGRNRHQRRDRRLIGDEAKTQPMALSELPKHNQAAEAATELKKK